jgi:hypothetical protein
LAAANRTGGLFTGRSPAFTLPDKDIVAWALVASGLFLLATNLRLLYWWDWNRFWPILLIVIGAALLTRRSGPTA